MPIFGLHVDGAFGCIAAFEQGFGQRVFDFGLNRAFERAGAVNRVEACFGDEVERGIVDV